MNYRRFTSIVASLAISQAAQAAIDFSPSPRNYVSEGITYQEISFKDEKRTIAMEVPAGWNSRGASDRLQFQTSAVPFAEGLVYASELAAPQPLDDAATAAIAQQALADVPPGSQAVALIDQSANPLILEGHESFGVLVSYHALGQAFRRRTIIVNLPERRIVFRFTAPEKQFAVLDNAFRRAAGSWH